MATLVANAEEKKPNPFAKFFGNIGKGFKNFFVGIGKFFQGYYRKFVDGSLGTKLSFLIFGAGNFYHKQFIKGALFLAVQVLFWVFMIVSPEVNGTPYGFKGLANLALEGSEGTMAFNPETMEMELVGKSESYLMLLFGLTTIAAIILYIIVYFLNISSSYKADQDAKKGIMASTFKQDCGELLDSKFILEILFFA